MPAVQLDALGARGTGDKTQAARAFRATRAAAPRFDRRWHNRHVGEPSTRGAVGPVWRSGALAGVLGLGGDALATTGSVASSALLLGALCAGAVLALAAVVVAQKLRSGRELAALRRSLTTGADWWWRTDADLNVTALETGDRRPPWLEAVPMRGRKPWQFEVDAGIPAAARHAIDTRAPFYDAVVEMAAGPSRRLIAISGAPLFSGTGRFIGYAGVGRDLTELAAALAPAPAAASATDAAERERRLELAVRELDSFAHSVSHDLRAPLRVVDGFANIVLEDYAETGRPLDELGRGHLKRIVAAAQRMNSMIDTLLAMSKMTSRELQRERVNLTQLARDLAGELREQQPSRAVEFVIAEDLACDGDRTLLRMVLQNLIGNAFKFTARAQAPRIEFGRQPADPPAGVPAYFVRDNGAGFDMRFADRMFGLFQRLHSANEFPGTGVGLATVQRIVHKHGGRIWAEGAPGKGATFYFTLWEK